MLKKLVFIAQFPVDYQISIYNSCAKKFDVHVIFLSDFGCENAFDPEFGSSIKRFNEEREWKFTHYYLKNKRFKNNGSFFAHTKITHLLLLRKLRPDFVVVQGYYSLSEMLVIFFGRMIAGGKLFLKGESVLPSIDIEKNKLSQKVKEKIKSVLLRNILKRVCKVIYFSERNRDYWLNYGANFENLFWAPCVADASEYLKPKHRNFEIEKFPLIIETVGPRKVTVGFIGRLTPRKRILETVEIFPRAEKYQLLIAGSGELKNDIALYLKNKGINNVKLLGPLQQDSLFEFIDHVDIGILLSSYDPSPKVLNEFIDLDVPCVISKDIGTSHELIKDGISGYVIEHLSSQCILEAFEKIEQKSFFKNDKNFQEHARIWSGSKWAECFSRVVLNE